ncbi:hypothetical protein N792_07070 [Lysobacter concretionis Ko07 = DSM 16239]|uniref:Tyr recombinase domain-containing protein n=1 Tax=Lysobacter concretionis Ko07 = DSM 16239 TaxID=1122185 RepID=A0A0A0EPL6_9GAMM|nr:MULTISPECIES: site-specific integrase [Lysobacter]KGM52093.1 hypothetical protein N792_07070 [Lysobacter concretionis Ko07 = DSM 16239]QOD90171.1 site-specific integrase [Lysobacter sp. CW239]
MKVSRKLSPAVVEGAKPEGDPYRVWDTQVPQLFLRVQPSGVKSFNVQWSRTSSRSLGKWPGVTVEAARKKARDGLVETDKHGAPLAVIQASKPVADKPLTLREFVEGDYQEWVKHELKRGTEAVNRILSVFAKLAATPLPDIDQKAVESIITARRRKGVTTATTNRDLAGIKAALAKAVEWKLLKVHPLTGVKPSRVTTGNVVRYLTTDEAKALREALAAREATRRASRERHNAWHEARGTAGHPLWPDDGFTDHLAPMVLLAMNTGLRRGELFGLEWKTVNLAANMLTVTAASAKSEKTRHVPLNIEASDVLTRWKKQSDGTGLVFPSEGGARMGSIKKSWAGLTTDAKLIDFRFHDLRHDFASKLVMGGVDLNTVRELLGHSDIKMTLRYAHLAPDHLAAAVAKLGAMQ